MAVRAGLLLVGVGVACLVAGGAVAGGAGLDTAGQLNPGLKYVIANAEAGHEQRGFDGEFFDIYSPPIRSQYSQVIWKVLDPVRLPEDIISRFDNRVMAVTGTEVNVIRKGADGQETLVSCKESYNHHYVAFLKGKLLAMRNPATQPAEAIVDSHGTHVQFDLLSKPPKNLSDIPAIQAFSEHNGNEARQTYHGLPRGAVQPIQSPETFVFGPMQINTRNPDGSGKTGGPLPRASKAPKGADYSGLLECPCTTRVTKNITVEYQPVTTGQCAFPVTNSSTCFAAARELLGSTGSLVNTTTVNSATQPPGCNLVPSGSKGSGAFTAVFNTLEYSKAACDPSSGVRHLRGSVDKLVRVGLELTNATANQTVTITLSGPAGEWFGVGFNASKMADLPYTIVVNGTGGVEEHKLGNHVPGTLLQPSVTVVSSSVSDGVRTVTMTRPLAGRTRDHGSFSLHQTNLPLITALGSTPAFAQHKERAATIISLLSVDTSNCVCEYSYGTINGFPFNPKCKPYPYSDLLPQQNPTCDIRKYVGGMACCRGDVFLLDADQEIPPEEDEVYFKWRFYFKEWDPSVQFPVQHSEWQWGHIEYDVPQAPAGTPPEDAVHTLTTRFQVKDIMKPCNPVKDFYCLEEEKAAKGIKLIMFGGHCHSPACLGIELYNRDSGQLLCHIKPMMGTGGSQPMNESSYVWLPPCQWGDPADGLAPPPILMPDTNLIGIKRANSSVYHYGVMSIWQGRVAYVE